VTDEREDAARLEQRDGVTHEAGRIRDVLDGLEARHEAETPGGAHTRMKNTMLDEPRDAGIGAGYRRDRRLDPADGGEAGVE
jgi:hypothetical protein